MFIFMVLLLVCSNMSFASLPNSKQDEKVALNDKLMALIAGTIAGITEPLIAQPLTILKNRAQLGTYAQPLNVRELWRGAPVASVCLGFSTGIQTGLNAIFTPLIDNTFTGSLAAGAASAYLMVGPAELTIAQQQIQKKNAIGTIVTVYRAAGPKALWRGSNWCAAREACFSAGYLSLAPLCAAYLKGIGLPELPANIAGGVCGGIIAMIASHPCDTIKTRMAADIPLNNTQGYKYSNGFQVMSSQPLRTLFNGCMPRVLNGTFAITWFSLLTPFIQRKLQGAEVHS